jgi:hypothetical protein
MTMNSTITFCTHCCIFGRRVLAKTQETPRQIVFIFLLSSSTKQGSCLGVLSRGQTGQVKLQG